METKDNKYLKWYWNIIENVKQRILPEGTYIEKHHLYPRGIYGEEDNEIIVALTAKEHYIVHACLWQGLRQKYGTKDSRTQSMCYAFSMMQVKSPDHQDQRYNSKLYGLLKEAYNERGLSEETKLKIGKGNKGKLHSEETKKLISERTKEGMQKVGWSETMKEKHKNGEISYPLRSEEQKDKVRGEKNGQYGKSHKGWGAGKIVSEETKQKIREKRKLQPKVFGRKLSPESIEKMKETKRRNRELKKLQEQNV